MAYTIENLFYDLEGLRAWNDIRDDCEDANIDFKSLNTEMKAKVAKALNKYQYDKCPQEYKDNPHIHYEVAKKKK